MRYLSVCSGIEAATVAWHPLGWEPAGFAEIEKFPSAVLKHHYPKVKNFGDFTKIEASDVGAIDLLVGGTPCQDFSVAGLRAGMDGARGQLTTEFAFLARRLRPRWLVWENVPGVLSIDEGRAFGAFLGILGQLGYGFAYRVLDAQHFGVPQRRRRVFVVGYFGDWRRAAAVLFERHGLSGHPPPRREAGKGTTYDVASCIGASGRGFERTGDTRGQDCLIPSTGDISHCLNAGGMGRQDYETETLVTHSLRADGFDTETIAFAQNQRNEIRTLDVASSLSSIRRGDAKNETILAFSAKDRGADAMEDCSPTLRAGGHTGSHANAGVMPAVAIRTANTSANGHGIAEDVAHTLDQAQGQAVAFNLRGREGGAMAEVDDLASIRAASGGSSRSYIAQMQVRRLLPIECERLMGFPDNYTKITEKTADGPRYRALGNSMAVPVMAWIGHRILEAEAL